MAKKRTKAINRRKNARQKVKEPVGHAQAQITQSKFDDPGYSRNHNEGESGNHREAYAQVNMRESPVAMWFFKAKPTIDQHQYRAASDFRKTWERATGSLGQAIDYSAVKVDTSGSSDPIHDGIIDAVTTLTYWQNTLTTDEYWIMERVVGQRVFLKDIFPRNYHQKVWAKICREGLRKLSEELGYQTRRAA